ncbi:fused DSP-PTPase phosphatase/NAD kinase-like protein [Mangrovicoccus algicola]|uniref:Tyrosine-protein phosphatase n=1 Tax=Mangrovicoccus algicola TaxID=2771008 RepID=A0A8J7D0H4_9RHOB|nr:tyrosine-protein phosphatase [Mangrovicoccus algicola]MBE3639448.1 tyrosine-protein phosphatase [Mangrovicoccus algicola]
MANPIKARFREFEHRMRKKYGRRIGTPAERRQAMLHFHLLDHGFLRTVWWNMEEIAPGIWRSNQPSPRRVAHYAKMGIRTIINLRGEKRHSPYLFEREACDRHGITLLDIELSARKLVSREDLLRLLDLMRRAERPMLMHCKSGSDRAGFAAVLYLAVVEGRPLAEARRHLHWKYLHLSSTDTGILDHVLDVYEADSAATGQTLEDWIATRYDHEALTRSWKRTRK